MDLQRGRLEETTNRLVVEGFDDPLAAFSRRKRHLNDHERLALDNLAADYLASYGSHGALDIGGSRAGSEVLRHDAEGAGEATNGEAHGFRGGLDDVDLAGSVRRRIHAIGGGGQANGTFRLSASGSGDSRAQRSAAAGIRAGID